MIFQKICHLFLFFITCTFSLHAEKPNIIFVLADDLGWAELGCYGNTFNETPNLDKLAKQGVRFTHAYAAALFSLPSRPANRSTPSPGGYTGLPPPKFIQCSSG